MSDWKACSIGELILEIGDGGTPSRAIKENFGGDIPWVVIDDIQHEIWETKETLSQQGFRRSSAKLWQKDSIVLSTGATIGEVGIARVPLTTKQGISGIVCGPQLLPEFFYYKLQSLKAYLNSIAQGSTIREVRPPLIKKIKIDIPTLIEEQRAIADILSTLDEAIAQSESLVRKYQSIKQGLMSDLLTRGVDENGEVRNPDTHAFKDSEIGQIPADWKIATLGQITATATDGPFGSNLKTEHYREDGVRVVRLQNIGEGVFDDIDKAFVSEEHASRLSKFEVRSGDLLIAAMGDENHPILRACLYPKGFQPGIVKADCFRFRFDPKRAINPYVMWLLTCRDTRSDLRKLSQGVTRDRINLKNTQTIRLRIPTVAEQKIIVDILDAQQVLLEKEKDQLEKLKLLKQGLMQDLLGGQVRVKV